MDNEEFRTCLEADYIDPMWADKFDRVISAKMADAKSQEVELLKEQLDFIREQAKSADKKSNMMFAIAVISLIITAVSLFI